MIIRAWNGASRVGLNWLMAKGISMAQTVLTQPQGGHEQVVRDDAAGIPPVLGKPPHVRGALATSDAPVAEGEPRERIYRAFIGPQLDIVYLQPLLEYAVDGHSWDETSWRETGNVYRAPTE